jgi:voltage-gated potassium channel
MAKKLQKKDITFRDKIRQHIFETETKSGKIFNIIILTLILLSVLSVMLESVESIDQKYHEILLGAEWFLTIIFSIEYLLRAYSSRRPIAYITSFYGIIDLLSILPMFVLLIAPLRTNYLTVVRVLRLLRIFRIFKLAKYIREGRVILEALRGSLAKITVFLFAVTMMVLIFGSAMYVIEGGVNSEQFSNIPQSIYWAVATITTVGYGDLAPVTSLGRFIASIIMLSGYAIIAVPTGIVTMELNKASRSRIDPSKKKRYCAVCERVERNHDADYCKFCGEHLIDYMKK